MLNKVNDIYRIFSHLFSAVNRYTFRGSNPAIFILASPLGVGVGDGGGHKGYVLQESKHEVPKVIPLCKNGQKHENVSKRHNIRLILYMKLSHIGQKENSNSHICKDFERVIVVATFIHDGH